MVPQITKISRVRFLRKAIAHRNEGVEGSLVVRGSDSRPEGLGSMPDASEYTRTEIVEVEIGGAAIYRPFEEFIRAKSYCHLYGAQSQRQAYL
ncbi:hypothetical protein TNCV_3845001 [Trichonephila clavipes]|nr:hypothetical protein TNCV_3845001 [Trichonephila clavipes]